MFEPPIKFGPNSKAICFLDFEFKFYFEFDIASGRKVVHNVSIYSHAKLGEFWSARRVDLVFYKSEQV
jgi:hypothetical protein